MELMDGRAFHALVEDMVASTGCGYLEAIMEYQEKSGVEVETVAALVKSSPALKAKLEEESETFRLVKPSVKKLKF